jgi:hypothetical protein
MEYDRSSDRHDVIREIGDFVVAAEQIRATAPRFQTAITAVVVIATITIDFLWPCFLGLL